jgi:hypothetical protein
MGEVSQMTDYIELAELADRILEISGDDVQVLAKELGRLDPQTRGELFTSDLLNACQVFYYSFQQSPTELGKERLILSPASALRKGVLVDEFDACETIFTLTDCTPAITVSDGDEHSVTFEGPAAYRSAIRYISDEFFFGAPPR